IAAIPGVQSVGIARQMPMDGLEPGWNDVYIEGQHYDQDVAPLRYFNYISPGYFHAQGTRIIAGRDYTWTDVYGLRPVGIVSESMARESWGSAQAALGKQFGMMTSGAWIEVIGVAEDVHQNGVAEKAPATVYWPLMMKVPYEHGTIETQRGIAFTIRSDRA